MARYWTLTFGGKVSLGSGSFYAKVTNLPGAADAKTMAGGDTITFASVTGAHLVVDDFPFC
jgi:hypothetical protein